MGKTKPALKRTTRQAVVKQPVEDQPIKRKRESVQPDEVDEEDDVFDQEIIVLPAAKAPPPAAAARKKQKIAAKDKIIAPVEEEEEIVPEKTTRKSQKSAPKDKSIATAEEIEETFAVKKTSMSSKETLAAIKEAGMILSPKTASSALKQVLSFQATQEMSVQMAKMQDELTNLRVKVATQPAKTGRESITNNDFYREYKDSCDKKFDEYENTIAQLQIDLASKSKSFESLEANFESLESSFTKERETSKILDAELTKSKQELTDRSAEVEFLQAQVLEFDAKINVAGKSCIAQLEAQVTALKTTIEASTAVQTTQMYQRSTGMVITNITDSVFDITHTGSVNVLRYKLRVPEEITGESVFTYYPEEGCVEGKGERPEYLGVEIEFRQLDLFFERVFGWVSGR